MFSIELKLRIGIKHVNMYNDVPIFLENLYKDDNLLERSISVNKITKVMWTTKFFNRYCSFDSSESVIFKDKNGDATFSLDKSGLWFSIEYN